mmetsp:Transcript_97579/g.259216  ORF Transcript_97579/g.259216 Transcript_97579/m.259216 type:complete len:305 (+) Transcript_97579:1056-1970(+)
MEGRGPPRPRLCADDADVGGYPEVDGAGRVQALQDGCQDAREQAGSEDRGVQCRPQPLCDGPHNPHRWCRLKHHRGQSGRALRPGLEPYDGYPGSRASLANRSAPGGCGLPALARGHDRGEDLPAADGQAAAVAAGPHRQRAGPSLRPLPPCGRLHAAAASAERGCSGPGGAEGEVQIHPAEFGASGGWRGPPPRLHGHLAGHRGPRGRGSRDRPGGGAVGTGGYVPEPPAADAFRQAGHTGELQRRRRGETASGQEGGARGRQRAGGEGGGRLAAVLGAGGPRHQRAHVDREARSCGRARRHR